MDPVTITAAVVAAFAPPTLVASVIGGWLGNRGDHYLCKTYDIVQNQLRNPSEPTNHDIQRAVRGAYLKATLVICQRLIARESNVVQRLLIFPTVDIARVVRYLKKQLDQLPNVKFDLPANAATAQYELLLQPRGETAGERVVELTQQLRTDILNELSAAGLRVEDDLKAAILTGLPDQNQRVDWYELVCAFFAEELKANSRLSTITETNLLLEMKALMLELKTSIPDVEWSDKLLDQQTERLGRAMEPFVEQFAELMTRLDEMLVVLVRMEGKIDRVQVTVEAGNAQILDVLGQLQPQSPARAKYLNRFARYDSARLIGRVTELADIDTRLARQKMLLLRGMGGIGKTTLAKAYLDRSRDAYTHLAYVEIAGSIADSMLRELSNSDAVDFTPNPDHTTDEKFDALLNALRTTPNLLLVLDNIRDADAAADLRKRKAALESLDATVLITGRVRLAEFVQTGQLMELGSLAPGEARTLFERSLGRPVRDAETELVNDILEKAFYHAKLIEVVATQISRNVHLSLGEAKDMVAKRQFDDEELNFPDDIDEQAQTIYLILKDLFNTDPLADDLKQPLRYFAVLPAIDIPVDHVTALLGIESKADRKTLSTNLRQLAHTAWLDQLDGAYFSMHGLVQWVVRERLQPMLENCAVLLEGTAKLFYDRLTSNPLDTQPYLVYGDELIKTFQEDQNGPLTTLYNNIASSYRALGDNQKALEYNLKALSIHEQTLAPTHSDLAVSYSNIAVTYGALGDNQKALEYNLKALHIREQTLAPTHSDLAVSYSNIAVTYGALGDNQKALEYNQKVLSAFEQTLAPTHPYLAKSYANIAVTYGALGNNQKALEYNLKSLHIREQTLAPTHPDLAMSYANIGATYGALGDHDKELAYDLKSLHIREQTLAPTHPDLATSYANIAITYYYVGDLAKALAYMQKAVSIWERILPPTHPDLLRSQRSLAFIKQAIREQGEGNGP
ncbi:tetratricopeptide repeat protein [Spirosoma arcticum]